MRRKPLRRFDAIWVGSRSHHGARRLVSDPEHQAAPAFVGKRHAVLVELRAVELPFRLLELQALVLGGRLPPEVDLFGCYAQGS